ncbi:unnamed protein product [Allacma fusca]|uniref:Uncharacterized protein n=1 Tax=Allacma fusca TaxID=39272 RepID=A0A8J2PDE1_9HEXA|nr:unnamed protein product [Allacma fusca]
MMMRGKSVENLRNFRVAVEEDAADKGNCGEDIGRSHCRLFLLSTHHPEMIKRRPKAGEEDMRDFITFVQPHLISTLTHDEKMISSMEGMTNVGSGGGGPILQTIPNNDQEAKKKQIGGEGKEDGVLPKVSPVVAVLREKFNRGKYRIPIDDLFPQFFSDS